MSSGLERCSLCGLSRIDAGPICQKTLTTDARHRFPDPVRDARDAELQRLREENQNAVHMAHWAGELMLAVRRMLRIDVAPFPQPMDSLSPDAREVYELVTTRARIEALNHADAIEETARLRERVKELERERDVRDGEVAASLASAGAALQERDELIAAVRREVGADRCAWGREKGLACGLELDEHCPIAIPSEDNHHCVKWHHPFTPEPLLAAVKRAMGERLELGSGSRAESLKAFARELDTLCDCGHPHWQHKPEYQDCDEPCTICECEMYDKAVIKQARGNGGE